MLKNSLYLLCSKGLGDSVSLYKFYIVLSKLSCMVKGAMVYGD